MTTTRSLRLPALACIALGAMACTEEPNASASTTEAVTSLERPADAEARDPFFATKQALALDVPSGVEPTAAGLREAAEAAERLPKKEDSWVLLGRAWCEHARAMADADSYTRADAAADVALALRPGYGPAQSVKGLALLDGHRFQEARDLADRILAEQPDDPMALGIRSDALLELGDLEGAERAAARMMELKPNLPSYSRVAWISWLKGDVAGAKEGWRLAFDAGRGAKNREPASWVLVEAARLFFEQGDAEGALAGADYALQYNPGYPPAEALKGRCLLALGKHDEASELLARVSATRPEPMHAYWLGQAYRAQGRPDDAGAAFAMAEERSKRDGLALARVLGGLGRDPERALQAVERERRAGRDGVEVRTVYALALARIGRAEEALAVVDALEKLGTPDALVPFVRGLAQKALGHHDEAEQAFAAALARNAHLDVLLVEEAKAGAR